MNVTPPPTGSSHAGLVAGHLLGGRYRLDDTLASGGMAQVWRGTDEVLRRAVAIKVLHPHLTADQTFVTRFRQEAIAVAKLSHPAIVSVYDTCSENGIEAIVMELVTGNTLRELLDSDPLDPQAAVNITSQVASALDVAHMAGLVHRDIKPANILLSEDGRVKVGDFGIAKAAESSTDLTQEGSFIGTAKYLAPEQVEGGAVDGRTDLYSLGVVLYEMLCGQTPFEADSSPATALARLHSDPTPPRQLRPNIPPPLEDITLRLLARSPDDRFPDANHVRAALTGVGGSARPLTTSSNPAIRAAPAPPGPPAVGPLTAPPGPPARPGPAMPPPGPPPMDDHTEIRGPESDRRWLVPALLILLTAVSLGIAGLLIGSSNNNSNDDGDTSGNSTTTGGGQSGAQPIPITGFIDFDPPPDGDGEEHGDELGLINDGDPATFWETELYEREDMGGLKPGVGFFVELEEATEIGQVVLESPSLDWDVEIYVADEADENSVESWGDPVASETRAQDGRTAIELEEPVEGQYVLFFFTRGGNERVVGDSTEPVQNSNGEGRWSVGVSSVRVIPADEE